MNMKIGQGRHRFEFELDLTGIFLRVPLVGEFASNRVTPWCWSKWSEVG